MSYLVRAAPGERDRLIAELERPLLDNDDRRVVQVRPFLEIKATGYAVDRFLAGLLATIIALLLFVTALGVFGMTSFSVTQRTKEVGTRRALGASRVEVVRQFLVESAILGAVGSALGLVGAVALNGLLVGEMDATPLSPALAVAGLAVLWGLGFAATILPALRAARLEPAIATRTV
jgi:putative ABC transport system permease protein